MVYFITCYVTYVRGLVRGFVNRITRDVYRCACGSNSESINCRAIVTKQPSYPSRH